MNQTLEKNPVSERAPMPKALLMVATVFLLGGLWSLVLTVQNILAGKWVIDLGLLGIPVFFGLRNFSRGWRTCALGMLWAVIVLAPIWIFFCNVGFLIVGLKLVEVPQDSDLPSVWTPLIAALMFFAAFWQYRVLTQREIRELFVAPLTLGTRHREAAAQI